MQTLFQSSLRPALSAYVPIVYSTRGGHIENIFYGSVAVVNRDGTLIAHAGDVDTPLFTRSALKPFQALPLIAHPRFTEFGLAPKDIAFLCASHNGETVHAEAASRLLAKVGLTESALQCGTHTPYWYRWNGQQPEPGRSWNALYHNCSGKHSGMLLQAALLAADAGSYVEPSHAVQQAIRDAVAYTSGVVDPTSMPWGIDGCSVPNFALPLRALARAYAWLTRCEADARYATSGQTIFDAMASHPEMVSGEGRNDLSLSAAGQGDWIAKVGADGVQTLASRSRGIGIAAKISDGNGKALMVAFCSVLEQLGMLDDFAWITLERWHNVPIKSVRGVEVGRFVSCVQLNLI